MISSAQQGFIQSAEMAAGAGWEQSLVQPPALPEQPGLRNREVGHFLWDLASEMYQVLCNSFKQGEGGKESTTITIGKIGRCEEKICLTRKVI